MDHVLQTYKIRLQNVLNEQKKDSIKEEQIASYVTFSEEHNPPNSKHFVNMTAILLLAIIVIFLITFCCRLCWCKKDLPNSEPELIAYSIHYNYSNMPRRPRRLRSLRNSVFTITTIPNNQSEHEQPPSYEESIVQSANIDQPPSYEETILSKSLSLV